ncbi:TPA: CopG family transcriptional regulator [Candidatus Bathyarchaeota archaeon]|nr:CopG family transcriptional regulator [Candidatus Bathyarchaeota archaeon]
MSKEYVNVRIPKKLYDEIKKEVDESEGEFKSVDEFVEFVLSEVLKEEEPEDAYTPEEEEEIKRRLRSLGYL